jgi:hypothetical protein
MDMGAATRATTVIVVRRRGAAVCCIAVGVGFDPRGFVVNCHVPLVAQSSQIATRSQLLLFPFRLSESGVCLVLCTYISSLCAAALNDQK